MLHSAERLNNMGYISVARPDWILRTTYLFFYTASIQYLSCLQGRKLSCLIRDSDIKFDDLAPWKQKLVEDFDTRRSAKALDRALEQKSFRQQPYRGAGTEVQ